MGPRFLPPLIYTAIVQSTNDHTWALFHVAGYYFVAFIILALTDFEAGKAKAQKSIANSKSTNRCAAVSPTPGASGSSGTPDDFSPDVIAHDNPERAVSTTGGEPKELET